MKIKRIPILWRIERFFLSLKGDKEEREEITTPGEWALNPRKQRARGLCPECGNTKFFKRKNKQKCTKCGFKIRG